MRRCPQHGFELSSQIHIFYNGLAYASRTTIDATYGGSITRKTAQEAHQLFKELAKNNYQAPSQRSMGREQDQFSALQAQLITIC